MCALAASQGCGRHANEVAKPTDPPEVESVVAQRSDASLVTELPGRPEPYHTARVCARVNGIVFKCVYEEGQVVEAGRALFRINSAPLRAQMGTVQGAFTCAQVQLVIARDKTARYRGLAATCAVSELEYTKAQAVERQVTVDMVSDRAVLETM